MNLSDVILRTTRGSLPGANTVPVGALAYLVDEDRTLRSDGSTWQTYGEPGGGGAHAETHAEGGTDPVSLTQAQIIGLESELAAHFAAIAELAAAPPLHAPTHAAGGTDPVAVTALAGFPGGTSDFLRADGTFATPPTGSGGGSGTPGGASGQVQFNDAGAFGGDAGLVFDKATDRLTVAGELAVGGNITQTINSPRIIMHDTVQIANMKQWRITVSSSDFYLATHNDAGALLNVPLRLTRAGAATVLGALTASSFSGSGANLTALNATNLSTGTVADARLTANVLKVSGGYPGGTVNFLRADGTFAAPVALPADHGDGVAAGTFHNVAVFSRDVRLRYTGSGVLAISGFYNGTTGSAAAAGDRVRMEHRGTGGEVRVLHEQGSTDAYRIKCQSTYGQVLGPGGALELVYDGTRWVCHLIDCGTPINIGYDPGWWWGGGNPSNAGAVQTHWYQQRGKVVTYALTITSLHVTGTPAAFYSSIWPYAAVGATRTLAPYFLKNDVNYGHGSVECPAGVSYLAWYTGNLNQFVDSTGASNLSALITYSIQ